jgi:hypothetical protein
MNQRNQGREKSIEIDLELNVHANVDEWSDSKRKILGRLN